MEDEEIKKFSEWVNIKLVVDRIMDKVIREEMILTDDELKAIEKVIASYSDVYDFGKVEELVKEQMILKLSNVENVFEEEQ